MIRSALHVTCSGGVRFSKEVHIHLRYPVTRQAVEFEWLSVTGSLPPRGLSNTSIEDAVLGAGLVTRRCCWPVLDRGMPPCRHQQPWLAASGAKLASGRAYSAPPSRPPEYLEKNAVGITLVDIFHLR